MKRQPIGTTPDTLRVRGKWFGSGMVLLGAFLS